jgi:hypothetical protein
MYPVQVCFRNFLQCSLISKRPRVNPRDQHPTTLTVPATLLRTQQTRASTSTSNRSAHQASTSGATDPERQPDARAVTVLLLEITYSMPQATTPGTLDELVPLPHLSDRKALRVLG